MEHARMPISSLSSQRNLNRMLLETTGFRRKRLSLFLQLCTDLEKNALIQVSKLKLSGLSLLFLRFYAK